MVCLPATWAVQNTAAGGIRLRILYATYWTMPGSGGIDTSVKNWRARLEAAGHTVDTLGHHVEELALHTSDGLFIEEQPGRDIANPFVHLPPSFERHFEVSRYAFELCCAQLGMERYDIVHTHDVVSTRAMRRILPAGVPLVATLHGSWTVEAMLNGFTMAGEHLMSYLMRAERAGIESADHVFVPSMGLRRQLSDMLGVPPDRMEVLANSVDVQDILRRAGEQTTFPEVPEGSFVLLCPGRLVPEKGHRDLLEAVALLLRKGRRIHLWIAGKGHLLAKLQEAAKGLGIAEHVAFLGHRSDLPALMRRADAVVAPSVQDVLPHTVAEAQVVGAAVVATRIGGIPEMVVHGRNGLLARARDPYDLSEKIDALVADERLRTRLARTAAAFGRRRWRGDREFRRLLGTYEALRRGLPRTNVADAPTGKVPFDPAVYDRLRATGYAIPDPLFQSVT